MSPYSSLYLGLSYKFSVLIRDGQRCQQLTALIPQSTWTTGSSTRAMTIPHRECTNRLIRKENII